MALATVATLWIRPWGDTAETVATWNSEIEPHLEKADDSTRRIQQQIKDMDMQEAAQSGSKAPE